MVKTSPSSMRLLSMRTPLKSIPLVEPEVLDVVGAVAADDRRVLAGDVAVADRQVRGLGAAADDELLLVDQILLVLEHQVERGGADAVSTSRQVSKGAGRRPPPASGRWHGATARMRSAGCASSRASAWTRPAGRRRWRRHSARGRARGVALGRQVALLPGEDPHRLVDQLVDAAVEILRHAFEAVPERISAVEMSKRLPVGSAVIFDRQSSSRAMERSSCVLPAGGRSLRFTTVWPVSAEFLPRAPLPCPTEAPGGKPFTVARSPASLATAGASAAVPIASRASTPVMRASGDLEVSD